MSDNKSKPAGAASTGSEGASDELLYGVLAEYDTPGALIEGAKVVRDAGFTRWDSYSPFPVHGIDPAMGIQRTVLPWIVFAVGLCGLGGGLLLQWWTNAYEWPWLVSGKPYFSLPANIPITFETTVLLSAFAAFFGMWALNRLPQVWHPLFRSDRFAKVTDNGFFIAVEAADPEFDRAETAAMLETSGAVAVEEVRLDPDPAKKQIPRAILAFVIVTTALAVVPFVMVARARVSKSQQPHVHVFAGMDFQFKTKAQAASPLFADNRGSRPPVEGTVARGELRDDDHFYRGRIATADGRYQWATSFPPRVQISERTIERGRQQYDVFCAPCHGVSGYGDGMVHTRALQVPGKWVPPTSLHGDIVIQQPHGQLFNTITSGVRNMPGYGAQIPEEDRWAIVLYMRALQRSQNAAPGDAPEGKLAPPQPAGGEAPAAPAEGEGGGEAAAPPVEGEGGGEAAPAPVEGEGGGAAEAGEPGGEAAGAGGAQPEAAQPAAGAGN